jgi:uncharacterized protein
VRARALLWPLPLLWGIGACALAQDLQPVPALEARVNDLTGTLTAGQQAALEDKLASFESRKGAQVAVLLVPTTAPEDIEQFSIRVVEKWRLGREAVDDGALLLIAKDDRRMRIETGYGLEGALTDATAKRIVAETITPLFRHGDFYGGIDVGLEQIMRVIDGEPLPPPDKDWRGESPDALGLLPLLFVVVIVAAAILRSLFGRGLGAVATGGLAGGIAWLMAKLLPFALFVGLAGTVLALFGGRAGRGWSSTARHGGWGGGWGSLGGGGGLRGGGGFGGGGGGFGGGGASGSW